MTYDAVIIGAGLGGLTAAAILARAGRKVFVIERNNSVGGAASSYKVGDLFVEGSLHETSNPHDPRDAKHDILKRAGVLDAVTWVPTGTLFEVRGGPLTTPFVLPDDLEAARVALRDKFPEARDGVAALFAEFKVMAASSEAAGAMTLAQRLTQAFGDNEAAKCAIAANLWYTHDDASALWWPVFGRTQGALLAHGARFIQGGSQRLSSALARAVRAGGGQVVIRRIATRIALSDDGATITHSAKDGSDPQTVETKRIIGNAGLDALAELLPSAPAAKLREHASGRQLSISLFAMTLGLSKPPREFGVSSYSTQLLPPWMTRLDQYAEGTSLMAHEPGERMPPLSVVDYAAIDSAVPAPPHVLSVIGPDRLSNWSADDMDTYRDKRGRWQDAIVRYLDQIYPGIAGAIVASSFNTALSVRQYLNAPNGAVYGYAPLPPSAGIAPPTPRTGIPGFYLASNYGGTGGYTGAIAAGGACADIILSE